MARPRPAVRPAALGLALALGLSVRTWAAPAVAESRPSGNACSNLPQNEEMKGSGPQQLRLAEHLRRVGALFYGACWCSHCHSQKAMFGRQAAQRLPYVECADGGAGARACEAAGITAYPTWVLGQERRLGVLSLEELMTWTRLPGAPRASGSASAAP